MRRVVVTGLGAVTPIGKNIPEFSDALFGGACGAAPISKFDTEHFPVTHAYEVKNFEPDRSTSPLDPFVRFLLEAARQAGEDSGLDFNRLDPFRVGISASSSKGGVSTIERYGERIRQKPSRMLAAVCYASLPPNIGAQWIARKFKIKGPAICYVAACATGLTAIIEGARLIQENRVDCCFAGAGDASITRLMLAGYRKMGVLAGTRLMPFDRARSGFVVGEGAGVVMLEELAHARARGARMYGEIIGTAYGSDHFSITRFDPNAHALSETLEKLFARGNLKAGDVDFCHAHGTATREGDAYESAELARVFGNGTDYAPRFSAIKGATGHMLGASGACEFITLLLSLKHQAIPPVSTLEKKDAQLKIALVEKKALQKKIEVATAHNMGFGGHIAAVAVRKFS